MPTESNQPQASEEQLPSLAGEQKAVNETAEESHKRVRREPATKYTKQVIRQKQQLREKQRKSIFKEAAQRKLTTQSATDDEEVNWEPETNSERSKVEQPIKVKSRGPKSEQTKEDKNSRQENNKPDEERDSATNQLFTATTSWWHKYHQIRQKNRSCHQKCGSKKKVRKCQNWRNDQEPNRCQNS